MHEARHDSSIPTFVSSPSVEGFSISNRIARLCSAEWAFEVTLVALFYFISGRLGVLTAIPPGLATAVWPPSGVAIAVLLIRGYGLWPGIFLGSFLVNFPILLNGSQGAVSAFWVACLVASGSTLQACVGRFLILRFIQNGKPLSTGVNTFKFISVETFTCMIAATLGPLSLLTFNFIPFAKFGETWITWWMGDLVGILAMTPFVLEISNIRKSFRGVLWALELFLACLLAAVVSFFIFGFVPDRGFYPLPYVLFIFVLWTAFRLQQIGTTFVILVITGVAIWGTSHGNGPFASLALSPNDSLLFLQTYIIVLATVGLSVSAIITERFIITRELRRFKFIVDHANDPHFLMNRDGRFVYVNKMACKSLGYSEKELLSMTIPDIDVLYSKEKMLDTFEKLGKEILPPFEALQKRKNGTTTTVEISARAYNLNNEFYVFSTARDISERKKSEEKLKRYITELEQYVSIASHDLKTPLRNISNFLELLRTEHGNTLNKEAQEYIESTVQSAKRMQNLIDALLEYSKIEWQPFKPKTTDLTQLVEVITHDLKPIIDESQAQIHLQTLPTESIDRVQMELVFRNLIQNAVKFRNSMRPNIEIQSKDNGSEWLFSIKDNGIGIKKAHQEKIFKMFQRLHTNEQFPGTGIGLAMTKKIIERQGGKIWVESEEGKGSNFYFTLPKGPSLQPPTSGL